MSPPKYAQLAATLRERITLGKYAEGLPSEAGLMKEFGMSRTTVRTALTTLLNEGLLQSASGVGYFVKALEHFEYSPQDDFGLAAAVIPEADSFTRAAPQRNPTQDIEVSFVHAPADVARRLRVDDGEVVVVRRRIRHLDGVPFQLNDSYYPREAVEGTEAMLPASVDRGVNRVLAENGFAQVRALDEIWIRMPNPEEVRRLVLGPGTPVAEHVTTGFTADDRVVRVVRAILPGDRNVITFGRRHPDHE